MSMLFVRCAAIAAALMASVATARAEAPRVRASVELGPIAGRFTRSFGTTGHGIGARISAAVDVALNERIALGAYVGYRRFYTSFGAASPYERLSEPSVGGRLAITATPRSHAVVELGVGKARYWWSETYQYPEGPVTSTFSDEGRDTCFRIGGDFAIAPHIAIGFGLGYSAVEISDYDGTYIDIHAQTLDVSLIGTL